MAVVFESLRKAVVYPVKLLITFGPARTLRFLMAYLFNRTPIQIRTRVFPESIWIRPRSSDIRVAYELFAKRELAMQWPLSDQPKTIIDGGANVGYASLAFRQRWPKVHILAIEPDSDNFAVLEKNCGNRKDIHRLQCGIWGSACSLRVRSDSPRTAWGLQFEPVPAGSSDGIAAYPMSTLIDRLPGQHCDLLKLDIEGAEADVFLQEPLDWIDRVSVILIETHGKAARDALTRVVNDRGFHVRPVGEKSMLWRPVGNMQAARCLN